MVQTLIRPGVNFQTSTNGLPGRGLSTDTGVCFMAGITALGRSDEAVLLHNINEFTAEFGPRDAAGYGYDAVNLFFTNDGGAIYFGRDVGPGATTDTHTFKDSSTVNTLAISATGPGASGLKVAIVAGAVSGYAIQVQDTNGNILEQSYDLTTVADAGTWATSSNYVVVAIVGSNAPTLVAAVALAGGADDRADITDTTRIATLNRLFPAGLGPGQVCYPGATTDAFHLGLFEHATATNRFALPDCVDTSVVSTLTAAVLAVRNDANADDSCGFFSGPWPVVPGPIRNTTLKVPPSALTAALMSAGDAATGNPNQPAAGSYGVTKNVLALSQPAWTDANRELLNTAGFNVYLILGAGDHQLPPRLYGYRTASDPINNPLFLSAGAARLRMAIEAQCLVIGQNYLFKQLDGQDTTTTHFGGDIEGQVMAPFYALGALYGDTAADAYRVDTGPTVNTPATEADNQLIAAISMRTSEYSEMVTFLIQAFPITTSL